MGERSGFASVRTAGDVRRELAEALGGYQHIRQVFLTPALSEAVRVRAEPGTEVMERALRIARGLRSALPHDERAAALEELVARLVECEFDASE